MLLKISIILTTFNPGRIIHKTLDSILSQKGIDDKFKLEYIKIEDKDYQIPCWKICDFNGDGRYVYNYY